VAQPGAQLVLVEVQLVELKCVVHVPLLRYLDIKRVCLRSLDVKIIEVEL
jgi:hypothetical protein